MNDQQPAPASGRPIRNETELRRAGVDIEHLRGRRLVAGNWLGHGDGLQWCKFSQAMTAETVYWELLTIINVARGKWKRAPLAPDVLLKLEDDIDDAQKAHRQNVDHPADVRALLTRLDEAIPGLCDDLAELRRLIRLQPWQSEMDAAHERANNAAAALDDVRKFVHREQRDPANQGKREHGGQESPQLRLTIVRLAKTWRRFSGRRATVSKLHRDGEISGPFVLFVKRSLQAIEPEGNWDRVGSSIDSSLSWGTKKGLLPRRKSRHRRATR